MSAIDSSISAVLGERARRQPDARSYTFIDYELDPAGDSETLTWFQVHRRAQVVAAELASCGSPGDPRSAGPRIHRRGSHHQRQGPPLGMRPTLPPGRIHPTGHPRMTSFD